MPFQFANLLIEQFLEPLAEAHGHRPAGVVLERPEEDALDDIDDLESAADSCLNRGITLDPTPGSCSQ